VQSAAGKCERKVIYSLNHQSSYTFIKINTAGSRFVDGKNTAKQLKSFIFARLVKAMFTNSLTKKIWLNLEKQAANGVNQPMHTPL
jgi:hypothetical protein